ncbi:hypothetical protein GmHk_05G013656 [Glycine max]|nr:hypothetical protein GmHk_05G013656 [Glycine max]
MLSATAIGALLGLGTQMYSNALRKLPYMRHPWEHVVGMGLGAVFVNQLLKWEAQVEQDLDKMLEKAKAANERRYIEKAQRVPLQEWLMWIVRYAGEKKREVLHMITSLDLNKMEMMINACLHGLWQLVKIIMKYVELVAFVF